MNLSTAREGLKLLERSREQAQIVVFLRHGGCPFFQRTLAKIKEARATIESRGVELTVVHMLDEPTGRDRIERAGLTGIHVIADPDQTLYQAAGLPRASLWQVAGPRVWKEAMCAIGAGHRPGIPAGDIRQMPGVLALKDGQIVSSHVAETTGDLPDLLELAKSIS